ncbi:hypothetical protein BaRGS_00012835 [Batillaria attramentaria]|uniref:Uncharacterized protein n=1 Tax=Batillaria attramentaria TaxID=370345 RepID=A0ABD0L919_9CAEN
MGLTIQVIIQALIVLSLVLAGSALTIVVGFHQLQSQTSILREGNSDEGEVQPKDADHSETSDPDESETPLLLSHDSLELPAEERYHQGVHKMYRFGQNQTLGSVDCETSSVTTVDCSSFSSTPGSPAEECRMPLFRNCASFDRRADTVQLSRAPSGNGTGSEQKTDRVKDSCTSVPRGSHDSRVSGAGQKNFKRKVFFICASLYFSAGLLNMYTMMSTDYVGKTIYGGDPDAERGSDSLRDYQTGVRFGSLGFVVYYVSYLLASVCHKRVHELLGYKQEYTLVELSTSACMATLALTTRIEVYFVLCVLAGFQRASYFVVPYAATNDLLQAQAQKSRQDGAAKLGLYMSVVAGTVPLAYSTIFPCVGPLTDAIGVASTPMWLGAACGCVSTVFFLTVGDL